MILNDICLFWLIRQLFMQTQEKPYTITKNNTYGHSPWQLNTNL
jgi:hypothetical protein